MIRVGILGAKGYAAGEALRILLGHPEVEVSCLQARVETPEPVSRYFPALRTDTPLEIEPLDLEACAGRCEAAILAMPHTVAQEYAPGLIERGVKVMDLSADFRFDAVETFETVYKVAHKAPQLNSRLPYALPELFRAEIAGAPGLACPGCYPTSVLLALAPLAGRGEQFELDQIVVNSLSGVSGAGRAPTDKTHFCSANESVSAYSVGNHRHRPEIEEKLARLVGRGLRLTFTTHLMPMTRGILSTSVIPLRETLGAGEVLGWFREFYQGEPFVRVLPEGEFPATAAVSLTNYCDIGLAVDTHSRVLIVVSAIDNLIKGASGQAVQAMNALYGLPEPLGLIPARTAGAGLRQDL